jgi:transcription termination factor Rho
MELPPGYVAPRVKSAPAAPASPPIAPLTPREPAPPRALPERAPTDDRERDPHGRRHRRRRWRDRRGDPAGASEGERAPREGATSAGDVPARDSSETAGEATGARPASETDFAGDGSADLAPAPPTAGAGSPQPSGAAPFGRRRRRRGRRGHPGDRFERGSAAPEGPRSPEEPRADGDVAVATEERPPSDARGARPEPRAHDARTAVEGLLVLEKGGFGVLRRAEAQYLPSKEDVWVPQHFVQRFKLRDGAIVSGFAVRGSGQHRYQLQFVDKVDGKDPREVAALPAFKSLTSIDPDFHYAVGDVHGDVSMRVLDVICPVGRGSRGLIVAPPRSGKTILMRKFAQAIETGYPDVELIVLLVDERPEEATEWRRSTRGQVFVSTNDESAKNHVQLAEVVWKRCARLVELGHDVVLLLDSITRLARAYNNLDGGSGRTMSGGLDSRAMEKPRGFFGSARNTETAGSLTILGTTLVDTGSRLDQLVFEEFKGTGNMEIVLSRKLADRRIFPAIDIERSGTRKEEKLVSARRLKQMQILRRVLLKMNFVEAMELLITKLEEVEKTDDFLKRFEVDPEA